jgi:hypothetical protein
MWAVSAGVRLEAGALHARMGRYGEADRQHEGMDHEH